ncbi:hypothetical protein D9M68_606990 [compost metagenome]
MVAKLSSASTICAASLAASVPLIPMAMPMSARLRAGESLTPSPVMATRSPMACKRSTRRSLWLGLVRANTLVSFSRASSSASLSSSRSAPVSGLPPGRPRRSAMAAAVAAWSPVIIFTWMPALWHSSMARMASSRGGSSMPTRPRRTKPLSRSAWSSSCWFSLAARRARPIMRRPAAAPSPSTSSHTRGSSGSSVPSRDCRSQTSSKRSGAPTR